MKTKDTDKKLTLDNDDFWTEIERQFWMSYKVSDKFGHIEKCQFSISKTERNLLSQLRAQCPEDWFKSLAEFNRSVFKVGRMVLVMLLEEKGLGDDNIKKAKRFFQALGLWEMNGRFDDMEKFANKILIQASTESPVNMKKVKEVERIKKEITEIKSAWGEE